MKDLSRSFRESNISRKREIHAYCNFHYVVFPRYGFTVLDKTIVKMITLNVGRDVFKYYVHGKNVRSSVRP